MAGAGYGFGFGLGYIDIIRPNTIAGAGYGFGLGYIIIRPNIMFNIFKISSAPA